VQADVHLGVAAVEFGEEGGQIHHGEGGNGAQGQGAPDLAGGGGHFVSQAAGGFLHLAGVGEKGAAGRGQGHPAGGALEEAGAQLLLQAGDLVAEGGLHRVAALGGPGEAAGFGHRHGIVDLAQVHGDQSEKWIGWMITMHWRH